MRNLVFHAQPAGFVKYFFLILVVMSLALYVLSCSDSSTGPGESPDGPDTSYCTLAPLPAPTGQVATVSTATELEIAVSVANTSGHLTIILTDGTYTLTNPLYISGDSVTVRSQSENRDGVFIRGDGMAGSLPILFMVAGKNLTFADMTLGQVAGNALHLLSDADNCLIHNVRFVDTKEQMLKVSSGSTGDTYTDNGTVEWCLFEYSAGIGPQEYIGGVFAHEANNWTVHHNIFEDIRAPGSGMGGYAIHFWNDSANTAVEHNIIVRCDRGIGFGLDGNPHERGSISNNMVHTTKDVGIGLQHSAYTSVYNNTLYTENYTNSIEYRFPETQYVSIINNLANALVTARDGATGVVETNVTNAQASWFVDAAAGDLHLATAYAAVVDQGQSLSGVPMDIDCEPRPKGDGYDIGADEF